MLCQRRRATWQGLKQRVWMRSNPTLCPAGGSGTPPWPPGPAKASAFERQLAMNGTAWAPSRVPAFALLGNPQGNPQGSPQLQQDTAGLLPPGSLAWAGAAARGNGWHLGPVLHGEHLPQQQQQHGAVWPGPYQPSGERMHARNVRRPFALDNSLEQSAPRQGHWVCWILSA